MECQSGRYYCLCEAYLLAAKRYLSEYFVYVSFLEVFLNHSDCRKQCCKDLSKLFDNYILANFV